MIVTSLRDVEISTIGEFKTKQAAISERGIEFIIDSLSDNLYSDVIKSIVREYTSNMQDAINVENKLDKPCYIVFSRSISNNTRWIEFQDYGSGMTPEFMTSVFMNWGDSTKRNDNVQIGGWGIGSKVGLAYQNEIYITTFVNNVCYKYILYKTNKLPELVLLNSFETDRTNGTTVKIEIKYGDLDKFYNACTTELSLFNNVMIMDQGGYKNFDNAYQVYTNDLFYIVRKHQLSSEANNHLTISLGFVKYYIPVSISLVDNELSALKGVHREMLRLKSLGSVILKFNIGEIDVTLSRENVKYTEKTIRNLIAKITEVDQYFYKYIEKIYDNNLDAVTRFSSDYIYDEKDEKHRLLNFREYIDLYYKEKENHFFETSTVLLNLVIKSRTHGSIIHPQDVVPYWYKYCISESNVKSDLKYRMKYFNLTSRESIIVYRENLLLWEYNDILNHFKREFNLLKTPKRIADIGNIGYAVIAKQQLVRSIKKNFINLETVPQEYIDAERKKDLEELRLKKKEEKAKQAARNQIHIMNSLESTDYNLKRKYQFHRSAVWGARLKKTDYIIASKNALYIDIIHNMMVSSNLNVLCFVIPENDTSNDNQDHLSVSDFFINSCKKDIDFLLKDSQIEIISKDADVVKFIEKYTDPNLLVLEVYKSIFIQYWCSPKEITSLEVYNKFINHKLDGMEDLIESLDHAHDISGITSSEMIKNMQKISKFTKRIEKIKKSVHVTLPQFRQIYEAYEIIKVIYPKHVYTTAHFVKEICNNISIKPLKTFELK